jgi:flagellar biosynthesis/type III secretory pathway ATPase
MALREAALAIGEPPATKGYPPSVFAALPRLLERAGTSGSAGVITALYTVLVEGDDLSDPVPDAVRSILDGHIVLTRTLADRGHFPAIDVLQSVSRLAPALMPTEQSRAVSMVRDLMATYRSAIDLIQVGAYVPGTDPKVDAACRVMPEVDAFLRQAVADRTSMEEAMARVKRLALLSGANGAAR